MKEYETYPDFAVYLFSQSIEYLCDILTKKNIWPAFMKKKPIKLLVSESMGKIYGWEIFQPGKGGGGGGALGQ